MESARIFMTIPEDLRSKCWKRTNLLTIHLDKIRRDFKKVTKYMDKYNTESLQVSLYNFVLWFCSTYLDNTKLFKYENNKIMVLIDLLKVLKAVVWWLSILHHLLAKIYLN